MEAERPDSDRPVIFDQQPQLTAHTHSRALLGSAALTSNPMATHERVERRRQQAASLIDEMVDLATQPQNAVRKRSFLRRLADLLSWLGQDLVQG